MNQKARYYLLKKELPNCQIGDMVIVSNFCGETTLKCNDISIPVECAENTEWFEPVTGEQHQATCEKNVRAYCEEHNIEYEKFIENFN